jgi:NTE family protein
MVVGSSVGALNDAHYAGNPTVEEIQRLDEIWRKLRRNDVFPLSWRTRVGFLYRRDFLAGSGAMRQLVDKDLGYRNLVDAKLPIHIVATDILTGGTVVMSEGAAVAAIIASAAVPGALRRYILTVSISQMERYQVIPRAP